MNRASQTPDRANLFGHCPEIDSLRALAMIAVVAMHAKLFPMGWAGVWLFFVISGYVVTLSIARDQNPREAASRAAGFAWRRAGRIVPAYYAYVLAGVLVALALGTLQPLATVASLLGFYHNIAMANGYGILEYWPAGHLWTIAVEMQFYLIYGLVAYFTTLRTTKTMLWAFIVLAPFARLLSGAWMAGGNPEHIAYIIYSAPGLHFDSFAMGSLFALARLSVPLNRLVPPLVRLGVTAFTAYAGAYIVLNMLERDRQGMDIFRDIFSGILYGEGREVFLYSALGLASLALLALTVARHPLVQRVTGLNVLHWIGRISYGAYIYHALCLRMAAYLVAGSWGGIEALSLVQRVMVFGIGLALTLVLAQLSWRYLELPAAAWIKSVRQARLMRNPAATVA